MRTHRLYNDQPIRPGGTATLSARNEHYLLHVLRVEAGQPLRLFDGSGAEHHAVVCSVSRKKLSVDVLGAVDADLLVPESSLGTTLAIGVSKGERMDWVVQKATELGISRIQPLQTRRVDVKLSPERWNKKLSHWQEVAISACEQCGRRVIPVIEPPLGLQSWLESDNSPFRTVLRAGYSPLVEVLNKQTPAAEASVLVGPEGGLAPDEFDCALQQGYTAASLGPRILRTETAPIVALSLLQAVWGDL